MKNKRFLFIFALICITIFCIFYYIFLKFGNNNSKEKIVDEILNSFNVYEADVTVTVYSNKNTNNYNMHQIVNHKVSRCIINEPEEINGLNIELNDGKLLIKNEKYNMEKVYENYSEVLNNSLFLNTFSADCINNGYKLKKSEENEVNNNENKDEIIIETILENNKNTYIKYKELYVDINNRIPKKLIIKDDKQKIYTSIIYNNVKIK